MCVKSKVFAAEPAVAGRPEHGGAAALNSHYGIEKAAQTECAPRGKDADLCGPGRYIPAGKADPAQGLFPQIKIDHLNEARLTCPTAPYGAVTSS